MLAEIALGVVIGGIVSSSFGSSIKSVDSSLSKYQEKVKSLNKEKLTLKAQNDPNNALTISSINSQLLNLKKSAKIRIALEGKKEELMAQKNSLLAVLGTGYALSVPLKTAIEFESSMADVKKVVNFTDSLDFSNFTKEILNLTKTIPLSANELAQITASGGQLGIAKDNLLDFTTTVAKMSTAFDMSASEAGDSIAKLMNVYGLTMNDVESLGDSINHLSDNSAAKASQVVDTLGRIGGVAKVFGLSSVQAGALSSAFIALGKSPEVAGTAINSLLLKLKTADKQGDKFKNALQSIGLDATELKNSIDRDAQGSLTNFLKTLEKLDKTEQMGVLSDLFGAEFSDDMALLVSGLENYDKALNLTAESSKYAGSMQREFESRSSTTANNLKLLSNSISTISINFGSLLLPAINAVIKPITYFSSIVGEFATDFPLLSTSIGAVVIGMFSLVAVVKLATVTKTLFGMALITTKGFLLAYSNPLNVLKLKYLALGGAIKTATTSLLWFGKALMANPIGLVIGAIALGAILIYTYWEPIKEFFSSLWIGIKNAFNDGLTFIKDYLGWTPLGMILNNWGFITGFFDNLWTGVTQIFSNTWTNIKNSFNGVVEFIKKPFEDFFVWIASKFEWINNLIGASLGALESAKNFVGKAGDFIGDGFKSASNFFKIDKENQEKYYIFDTKDKEKKEDLKLGDSIKDTSVKSPVLVVGNSVNNPDYKTLDLTSKDDSKKEDKKTNLGNGYTKALENTTDNSVYSSSNTNYTNNTLNNSKKNETSSIVVNINNPNVQSKEQTKALEQDIKKAVDIAIKEKEKSNMNRTFKDVA